MAHESSTLRTSIKKAAKSGLNVATAGLSGYVQKKAREAGEKAGRKEGGKKMRKDLAGARENTKAKAKKPKLHLARRIYRKAGPNAEMAEERMDSISHRSVSKNPPTGSPGSDTDAVAQDSRRGNRASTGGYGKPKPKYGYGSKPKPRYGHGSDTGETTAVSKPRPKPKPKAKPPAAKKRYHPVKSEKREESPSAKRQKSKKTALRGY